METITRAKEIANTIIEQIKYADRSALMAWGACRFLTVQKSNEFQGGISFYVNGLKFKGFVTIKLRWVDDYTITFMNRRKVIVKTFEGAYCDMLVPVIDWVEKGDK